MKVDEYQGHAEEERKRYEPTTDKGPLAALESDTKELSIAAQEAREDVYSKVHAIVGGRAKGMGVKRGKPVCPSVDIPPDTDNCLVDNMRRNLDKAHRRLDEIRELVGLLWKE